MSDQLEIVKSLVISVTRTAHKVPKSCKLEQHAINDLPIHKSLTYFYFIPAVSTPILLDNYVDSQIKTTHADDDDDIIFYSGGFIKYISRGKDDGTASV